MNAHALLVLAAAGLLAAAPETAPAPAGGAGAFHLRLLRSEPAADTTLTAAPAAIRLWFSQPVQLATTTIRVTGPGDGLVTLGAVRQETTAGRPVAAEVAGTLAGGRYQVHWRTMSRDGHPVSGQLAFTLSPVAPTQ